METKNWHVWIKKTQFKYDDLSQFDLDNWRDKRDNIWLDKHDNTS